MIQTVDELPITDRDPAAMSNDALHAERRDTFDITMFQDVEDELLDATLDRREAIWDEMASRVDAEPPACPECGAQSWTQTFGKPKECVACGLMLESDHEELIEEITEYWSTVELLDGNLYLGGATDDD